MDKKIIYPSISLAEFPNEDMPSEIKILYEEAKDIVNRSPRIACALLRLALENLIDHVIGENNNDLSKNILDLVRDNKLDDRIRDSMEIVRVIGNGSIHPAIIDMNGLDTIDTAEQLFGLINFITTSLITQPQKIKQLYDKLPAEERKKIERKYSQPNEKTPAKK